MKTTSSLEKAMDKGHRKLMIDAELMQNAKFRKKILDLLGKIALQFGTVIDEKFNGDVGKFKKLASYFRMLSARANKTRDLSSEEIEKLAKLNLFMRTAFKLGPVRFSLYDS